MLNRALRLVPSLRDIRPGHFELQCLWCGYTQFSVRNQSGQRLPAVEVRRRGVSSLAEASDIWSPDRCARCGGPIVPELVDDGLGRFALASH